MEKQTQTLARISPAKLEQFLLELANLRDDLPGTRRFRERFAPFIQSLHRTWAFDQKQFEENEELRSAFPTTLQDRIIESEIGAHWYVLPGLRWFVRRLWIEP